MFSRDEGFELANQIADAFHVSLADAIPGIPEEGILQWLEERFVEFLVIFQSFFWE